MNNPVIVQGIVGFLGVVAAYPIGVAVGRCLRKKDMRRMDAEMGAYFAHRNRASDDAR